MEESKKSRRSFIKQSSWASIGIIGLRDFDLSELPKNEKKEVVVVHSNDMHSHIDPFALDDPKFPGMGGMAERAALIDQLRAEHGDILLLDAGDIFQGTPYFNFFKGHLELELMSKMGYDAATMGNHDFDNGMDGFAAAKKKANFPFICSNYDFKDTLLEEQTIGHSIFNRGGIRIGVFGLGVELEGLVDPKLCIGVKYLDPRLISQTKVDYLRQERRCDIIICLSHLGYDYQQDKVSDMIIAETVDGIDLIIGGHTHTFLDIPTEIAKSETSKTYVNQVGWAGVRLGVLKFNMAKDQRIRGLSMNAKQVGISI